MSVFIHSGEKSVDFTIWFPAFLPESYEKWQNPAGLLTLQFPEAFPSRRIHFAQTVAE